VRGKTSVVTLADSKKDELPSDATSPGLCVELSRVDVRSFLLLGGQGGDAEKNDHPCSTTCTDLFSQQDLRKGVKTMFGRPVNVEFRPGRVGEANRIIQDEIVPVLQEQERFERQLLLVQGI
jgi:hypothetical protein